LCVSGLSAIALGMRADECRSLPWVDRGGAHLDPGGLFLQPKGDAAIPRLLAPRRTWLISSPFA